MFDNNPRVLPYLEHYFRNNPSAALPPGGNGYEYLEHAIRTHNYEFAKSLLEKGVDPFPPAETTVSKPLLNLACAADNETTAMKFINLLHDYGVNLNQRCVTGETALMLCCDRSYAKAVDYLLKSEVDVNIQSTSGWTALFYAASQSNCEIVEKLIAAKADITIKDLKGRTAFDIACARRATEIYELLDSRNEKFVSIPNYTQIDAVEECRRGFPGCVVDILSQMKFQNYAWSITNKHTMKFADFLNVTEEHLKEGGVYFSVHRHMILEFTRAFHITAWDTESSGLGEKDRVKKVDLVDCLTLILNIIFHIQVHRSTLHYLNSHYNKDNRYADDIRSNILQRISEIRKLLERLSKLMNVIESLAKRVDRTNMLENPYFITKDC